MNSPTLETIELQSGATPQASLIVLHGLGADGSDFVPVAEAMDLSAVGGARF
ncbi:MAG TPA: carboxylesterase, partial [Rubrivivax sp.]|nr:carboxylesterase [Rubrivivax sp.]